MSIIDFTSEGTIGASLKPKRYDIEIYRGDTFAFGMVFKDAAQVPVNITNWVGLMQVKANPSSPTVLTANVEIEDAVTGRVRVSLPDTSALNPGTYVYDLQFTNGSDKRTYIGGKIVITEDISE